jgi:hypothetical protein
MRCPKISHAEAALPLAGVLPVASAGGLAAAVIAVAAFDSEEKTAWPALLLPCRSRLARKISFALSTTVLSAAVSPRLNGNQKLPPMSLTKLQ